MSNTVTWSSSNKKIATVKGGVVTGRGKGTATITVKCGKLKAKCKITVKKENTKASRDNEYKKVYRDVILQFEKDKIYPYSLA